MKSHPNTTPTPRLLSWLSMLTVVLAIAVLLFTAPIRAQSSPPSDPEVEPEASAPVDQAPEAELGPGRCSCCQHGKRQGRGQGTGQGKGRRQMGQSGGGPKHGSGRPDAKVAHFLIENHEKLQRSVEIIPGGVRSRTVSSDLEIIDALRIHVRQMAALIEEGGRIRNWDPLFREIFDHRDAIDMEIVDIEGGVEVTETSNDEEVAGLIRAHAGKIEDFVARGIEAYREETPVPEPSTDTSP